MKKYSLRLRKLITSMFFPQAKFIYPTWLFSSLRLFIDLNDLKSLSLFSKEKFSRDTHTVSNMALDIEVPMDLWEDSIGPYRLEENYKSIKS